MSDLVSKATENDATGIAQSAMNWSSPAAAPKAVGVIDSYQAGSLVGWVWYPDLPETRVAVGVYSEGVQLGLGVAELFRPDLQENEIGDGKYGFVINLQNLRLGTGTYPVTLLDEATGQPIVIGAEFEIQVVVDKAIVINGIDGPHVHGAIEVPGTFSDLSLRVSLSVDGAFVTVFEVPRGDGKGALPFSAYLDPSWLDACPHVVELELVDYPGIRGAYAAILQPIRTPWMYIGKGADRMAGIVHGLPATAAKRYAALEAHLVAAATGDPQASDIASVCVAHQVLLQGHEGRKDFPKLTLPKVDQPDISIIIPVHNKFELTYNCIASIIVSSSQLSYEVIVADDCSSDKTVDIADCIENVKLVVNPENLGFLRTCNHAAATAMGNYLVLLNNDTEVTFGWLDAMCDVFASNERVGAVGAKLTYPDGRLQEAGGIVWENGEPWNLGNGQSPFSPEWNYVRQVDYLSGAAMMLPMSVWKQVDGFSDEFAPAYYEDTDLAFKVRAAGYRTYYTPFAEVVHFEGASHGTDINAGGKKNQAINAPKFREKWIDAYLNNGTPAWENVWKNKERGIRYRVLVIDYATPCPDHDAGSYAAMQEIRLLQSLGCKVTFSPENLAHFGRYTVDLQKMGVECIYAPFHVSMEAFLRNRGHEFDLVYITRYQVAERYVRLVREYAPRARLLFNNADLHFLRELRAALADGCTDLAGPLATRDRELAVMRQVDAILSYNHMEHAIILSHNLRDDNIFLCPWVLESRKTAPLEGRADIAFLGGYRHPPNVQAVEFFVDQVMPLLRKRLPGVKFRVFGSHVPASFDKYRALDDVVVEGFVENLDDVYQKSRVFVVPLQSGAGIKGKVLESMAYGIPMVLSPVAAEATGVRDGQNSFFAESPEEYAEAIATLYFDDQVWNTMSAGLQDMARREYSFEIGRKRMKEALNFLGLF